jgi:hypothetical protein
MVELDLQQQATLIRELFFNRTDVYANYYYSKKNSKEQWGPAKERGGEKNREYNWAEADAHFQGKTRIGAYPHDNKTQTCQWIVADFDDNVNAYAQTRMTYDKLKELGVKSHVERSKSGKGYHLWVFFQEPVAAKFARRMMKNALTQAGVPISGKFQKGSDNDRAMDRLFPAADMLYGEHGNLVGLPYHGESVKEGNTMFLNEEQEPMLDKWEYLLNCWQTRVDAASENVINLHDLEFEGVNYSTDSGTTGDGGYYGTVGALQVKTQAIRGCEAIEESINNANIFPEPAWQAILSNIAVMGSAGIDLAHEVSRGYNRVMEKGDDAAQYDPEETKHKYFKKVDFIQRNGFPTGCRKLSDELGWTCPRLEPTDKEIKSGIQPCPYRMIAMYGMSASILHNPALPENELKEVMQLEEQGLYDIYKDILPSPDYIQIYIDEDRKTGKPSWIPIKITDLKILENLRGTRAIRVKTYDQATNLVKSMYQAFDNVEDADKFERALEQYDEPLEWVRQDNTFWILEKEEMDRYTAISIIAYFMKQADIVIEEDYMNVSLSNFGLINHEWALAPFNNNYVDSIKIFDL